MIKNLIEEIRKNHGFVSGNFVTSVAFSWFRNAYYYDGARDSDYLMLNKIIHKDFVDEIILSLFMGNIILFYEPISKDVIVQSGRDYRQREDPATLNITLVHQGESNINIIIKLTFIGENNGTFTASYQKLNFKYYEALAKPAEEFDISLFDIFEESDYGISEYARLELIKEFTTIGTFVSKLFTYDGSLEFLYYKNSTPEWRSVANKISTDDNENIFQMLKKHFPRYGYGAQISLDEAYTTLKNEKLKEIGLT